MVAAGVLDRDSTILRDEKSYSESLASDTGTYDIPSVDIDIVVVHWYEISTLGTNSHLRIITGKSSVSVSQFGAEVGCISILLVAISSMRAPVFGRIILDVRIYS